MFQPQLPAAAADESDVTMVIESVDDLLHHAELTDAQEEDIRTTLARSRARLFANMWACPRGPGEIYADMTYFATEAGIVL